jgi:hypothetical protein
MFEACLNTKEMLEIYPDRSENHDTVAYRSASSVNESLLTVYLRLNIILLLADSTELIGTDKT